MLATASGNTMSVWDILSGGRVLQTVCAHSKTITSLCADASGAHLLSASLDHMVKVYELRRYKVPGTPTTPAGRPRAPRVVSAVPPPRPPTAQVVGSLKYAAPLLSVALSPASSHLVVGMSDNSLCVRRQATGSREVGAGGAEARSRSGEASDLQNVGLPGQVAADKSAPLPQDGSNYRAFLRGRNHAPQARPRHTHAWHSTRRRTPCSTRWPHAAAPRNRALPLAPPLLLAAGPDGRRARVS